MLEGGYRIQGGLVSAFARSVAAHVRALVEGVKHREEYKEEDLKWEQGLEQRQYDNKLKKLEEKLREQAERFRFALSGGRANATEEEEEAAARETLARAAALADEPVVLEPEEEGGGGGGRRKRRAASVKVDYVELAKKMKEEEKASKEKAAPAAEG